MTSLSAPAIVAHIKANPGCIKALYSAEDQPHIDESLLLNPDDWKDTSDPDESDELFWENWSEAITFADGIRCCLVPGKDPPKGLDAPDEEQAIEAEFEVEKQEVT